MSAFVVHTDTIDFLVAAAARHRTAFYAPLPESTNPETLAAAPVDYSGNTFRICAMSNPDLIGAILLAQNIRSVNYRYDLNDPIEEYHYRSIPYSEVDPVEVLKSVACLRYQSCETPDYDQTFAYAVLRHIEHEAIASLVGYEDAPWGWTRAQHEEKKAKIRLVRHK